MDSSALIGKSPPPDTDDNISRYEDEGYENEWLPRTPPSNSNHTIRAPGLGFTLLSNSSILPSSQNEAVDHTSTMLEAREGSLVFPIPAELPDDGDFSTEMPDSRTSVDLVHDESSNNTAVETDHSERTEHDATVPGNHTINQGGYTLMRRVSGSLDLDEYIKSSMTNRDPWTVYASVTTEYVPGTKELPVQNEDETHPRSQSPQLVTDWIHPTIRTDKQNADLGCTRGELSPSIPEPPPEPPAQTSILAVSDSDHASARHNIGKQVVQSGEANNNANISKAQQGVFGETRDLEGYAHYAQNDGEDTETDYPDISSATNSREEIYISELVEDLSRCMPIGPEAINDAPLRRLDFILPGLLRSFARRVGYKSDYRDPGVMVFVSRCRRMILARLEDHMQSREARPHHEPSVEDNSSNPDPAVKAKDWLESESMERDVECPKECFVDVSVPLGDVLEEKSEEPEIPQDLPHYRNFVVGNPAYNWLLSRLKREISLAPADPNHMQAVSDTIMKSLSHGPFQKLSYRKGPHVCDMTFIVDWDPVTFLREQEYDEQPEVVFERVLTFTGNGSDAQALTTAQYLSQTWPLVGEEMLDLFKRVIKYESNDERQIKHMNDRTKLVACFESGRTYLRAIGSLDSVAEIGEIIAWLGAALRDPPQKQGVSYCSPVISKPWIEDQFSEKTVVTSYIRFIFETEEVHGDDFSTRRGTGRCWHSLFQSPIVVKGYPTRRKPVVDIGIEIPLEIMANLAGSSRISSFARNMFIKSFCTMVVLTKQIGDIFIWHLIYNRNGEHISYTDPRIRQISGMQVQTASFSALASGRHVLGWCSKVSNLAGEPAANYHIRWSGLPNSPSKGSLEKFSISGGKFITASLSFALGKKDKPAYMSTKDDYINQLKWISRKFVVLYDVHDKRAWLVDGISTLLHLVRTSLHNDANENFTGFACIRPEQLKEADQTLSGKAAAFAVLCNPANQKLEIHPKLDEIFKEETKKEDGSSEEVTKTKRNYYCLSDRVQQIHHMLEQIITYQCQGDSEDGYGFGMKPTTRENLEGFDFMDVAAEDDPLWRRVTPLKASSRGWVDLTRAIHAPTLFGRGFGDILKPSDGTTCATWSKMPKDLDYLAVCCSDLNEIFKRHGDMSGKSWRIINDIHWHCPEKAFETCQCGQGCRPKCERIQVLVPNSFKNFWGRRIQSPNSFPGSGAVIFGSSRKFPLKWPPQGSPEVGLPGDTDDGPQTSSHDSGLGSSLGSTPQTESSDDASSSIDPLSAASPSVSEDALSHENTQPPVSEMDAKGTHRRDDLPSARNETSKDNATLGADLLQASFISNKSSNQDPVVSSAVPNRKRKMMEVVDRVLKKRK